LFIFNNLKLDNVDCCRFGGLKFYGREWPDS